jgi:hypothetical protein
MRSPGCRDRRERFATRSAVSPRPPGRLHRPDDGQAESREADGSRRTAALIRRETPGSPRLRPLRPPRGRYPRRSRDCGLRTTDGSVRPRDGRESCAGRTAGRMSTEAREVATGGRPYGCRSRNLTSIRRGSQRRLGRPSGVIAGATVTDSTVSLVSRRQAANRFAGSRSLSISSGPVRLLLPPSPSRARTVCALSSAVVSFRGSPGSRACPAIQARRAGGSCYRDPRWRV